MNKNGVKTTRVQVEFDDVAFAQLKRLRTAAGAASYGEGLRRILSFADYVQRVIVEGRKELDLGMIKSLFFDRL